MRGFCFALARCFNNPEMNNRLLLPNSNHAHDETSSSRRR
ncbi:hypothetical protein SynBIOSE41_03088 [Synechococcus sp. BIOS-E4-1]|nr:hypothetical protein SynBIOSE41_03088 [Synechococcus sp. BIOS-E4-1]